jgi:hypothetical protein
MKKWILTVLMGLSLAAGSGFTAFANDHEHCASCERECAEKCEKGEKKECAHKDHKKGCKDGKCATKKKAQAEKEPAEAT